MKFTYNFNMSSSKDIERMFFALAASEGTLEVGIPRSMRSRRGKNLPLWRVAEIQEYGYPQHNIPERPVLGPLQDQKGPAWQRSLLSRAMTAVRMGDRTPNDLFQRLAKRIRDDIHLAYKINPYKTRKPNAPSTIARKGRNDPLNDQGILADAWRGRWIPSGKRPPAGLMRLVRGFSRADFRR